ncbi:MAG: DUF1538 domain-containing protein [Firmicutes bacterium]|nr:DUF1538 domain-containing protein [Bacillota bacterium]
MIPLALSMWQGFGKVMGEVAAAVAPLLLLFLVFQKVLPQPRDFIFNTLKGLALAYLGLILFLQGIKVAFMPAGEDIGFAIGSTPYSWILIPVGFGLGFIITLAEPNVRVLSAQVEKASGGAIKSRIIMYTLCLGVALAIALGMAKAVYGISIYYLAIPGFAAALVLLKFADPAFVAIAFDAAGVATGPMTVTVVMAMVVGVATALEGRHPVVDGFGLVALVAITPILLVMALGFIYRERNKEENEDDLSAKP